MRIRTLVVGGLCAMCAACLRMKTVSTSAGPVAVRTATGGTLVSGVLLTGKLNAAIGASSSHSRDVIGITLSAVNEGKTTLVPAGAVAYGHVVAVGSGADAGVQIAFDSLTFGGGSHVLDANITTTSVLGVSVQPVNFNRLAANTVASATRISFGTGAQLSAGSTVTLVVVATIRLNP